RQIPRPPRQFPGRLVGPQKERLTDDHDAPHSEAAEDEQDEEGEDQDIGYEGGPPLVHAQRGECRRERRAGGELELVRE
nr:hypothetical protein [Chloroflexota bacterium]